MKSERIEMSQEQAQKISNMLQSQGVSKAEIDQIINGEYETCDSEHDLESAFGGLKKYGDILEKLSDGYTVDELQTQGISTQQIQEFQDMLQEKNLTVDNVKAIYQYSTGSNMILGIKRGVTKEAIQENIMQELEEKLQIRGVPDVDIEKTKEFVKMADYQETLHSNYDRADSYMRNIGIKPEAIVSVKTAMKSMDRCAQIDQTIVSLEEGLSKTGLPKAIKLYRAVKSSYLENRIPDGEDFSSLVGKTISNNGQVSTSPLYDSSFAKYDDYDTVFEIYAPQGTRGTYITELSAYEDTEQEVLLNPSDLYITNVQTGVIDKNGRTKNLIQALALSKDRECYKEVEHSKPELQQGVIKSEQDEDSTTKLPARQNRFARFFNKVRARFARHKLRDSQPQDDYLPQTKTDKGKVKRKKPWELNPDERAKIQKETVEIAKKYRDQQEGQAPNEMNMDEMKL